MNKVILVGTISNAEKQFERDFERVYASLHFFEKIDVFIVESDSSDSTIGVLNRISKKTPNFNYVSLGNLKVAIPNRIERIRKCRNVYVEYVRNNIIFRQWDYVIVADLDGMNSALKVIVFYMYFPHRRHGMHVLQIRNTDITMFTLCEKNFGWPITVLTNFN